MVRSVQKRHSQQVDEMMPEKASSRFYSELDGNQSGYIPLYSKDSSSKLEFNLLPPENPHKPHTRRNSKKSEQVSPKHAVRLKKMTTMTRDRFQNDVPSFSTDDGRKLPPPNENFIGFDHTPKLKKINVENHELYIYEYASYLGHGCQIEVVEGPDFIKGWPSELHRGRKSAIARRKCMAEFEKAFQERKQTHERKQSLRSSIQVEELTIQEDVVLEKQPPESPPELINGKADDNEPPSLSEEQIRRQQNRDEYKTGFKNVKDLMNRKKTIQVEKKKTEKPKGGFLKNLGRKAAACANNQIREGSKKLKSANRALKESKNSFKNLEKLQKEIDTSSSSTVKIKGSKKVHTFTKKQAAGYAKELRGRARKQFETGVSETVKGRIQTAAGKALKSSAKQFGKEVAGARQSIGNNLGALTADVIFNKDNFKNGEEALLGVGKAIAVDTVTHSAKKIAHAAIEGGFKGLAPKIAKKIPGINELNAVYTVGQALLSSNSIEEAIENTARAGFEMAANYGGAALGQALMPFFPGGGAVLGGYVGGLTGRALIHAKNALFG